MEQDIKTILTAAIQAPSGENSQPWRFKVAAGVIEQHHYRGGDTSLYNYQGWGTLTANGAALENLDVTARSLGYNPTIETFPDPLDRGLVARITLGPKGEPDQSIQVLSAAIPVRCTNRRPYAARPLEARVPGELIMDKSKIKILGRVASTNEEVMLGNRDLHHFFFSSLTWTLVEDAKKKKGFYIKTLELPPPVEFMFRIFKYWPVMSFLAQLGFTRIVGEGNGATYASSSAIGIIRISNQSDEEFLKAGRTFERIWLTATAAGVALQPLTGTLFMHLYAQADPSRFSLSDKQKLDSAYETLVKEVGLKDGQPALMFRIGYATPPTARALRYDLEHFLI